MRGLVVCVLAACSGPSSATPDSPDAGSASPAVDAAPAPSTTRLGLFPQGSYATPPALPYTGAEAIPPQITSATKIALANQLGATMLRTQARFLAPGNVNGLDYATQITQAGLGLVLTVLPNPTGADGSTPPLDPANVADYQANLEATIAATNPTVIMVENEEIAPNFYAGTPDTYALELATAVAIGHAHGLPVTNGGLTNVPTRLVTWYAMASANDWANADAFADATFTNPAWRNQFPSAQNPTKAVLPSAMAQITAAHAYLAVYAASDMDYMDLHLYEVPAVQLTQELDYIASQVGKPIVSTEMGQYLYTDDHEPSGDPVTGMLGAAVAHAMPFVIWYSADGNPAVALHDTTSASTFTLRAGGTAYAAFASAHH